MKENNNNSALEADVSNDVLNTQWTAEVSINNEIQNPEWVIKESEAKKLLKLLKKLPLYQERIPNLLVENNKWCALRNTGRHKIVCYKGFVVSYDSGLIIIKSDKDCMLENEILKSMPENIYKEIFHFI